MNQIQTLEFFGKSVCRTNIRQRKILKQSGVAFIEHDLLKTLWTESDLLPFLQAMPVKDWFNKTAPRVKSGEVDIDRISVSDALTELCHDPVLIRRPLLRFGRWHGCGFNRQELEQVLGVNLVDPFEQPDEGCSHTHLKAS